MIQCYVPVTRVVSSEEKKGSLYGASPELYILYTEILEEALSEEQGGGGGGVNGRYQ